MCEPDPRRANHIDVETLGTSNDGLTQNLVADLRTALRSLRFSIQIAARKTEDAEDPTKPDPCFDGS